MKEKNIPYLSSDNDSKNLLVQKQSNIKSRKKFPEKTSLNKDPKNKENSNKSTENKLLVIHHINCRSSIGKIEEIFQYC